MRSIMGKLSATSKKPMCGADTGNKRQPATLEESEAVGHTKNGVLFMAHAKLFLKGLNPNIPMHSCAEFALLLAAVVRVYPNESTRATGPLRELRSHMRRRPIGLGGTRTMHEISRP